MVERFGKLPSGEDQKRVSNSPNYKNGSFRNIETTSVNPDNVPFYKILKKMVFRPNSVRPPKEVPNIKTDLKALNSLELQGVWFGHSSYFFQVDGFNVLVDPVFSGNASPTSFFGSAFEGSNNFGPKDFPKIDLMVLTHDHYDHLDWPTIKEIDHKVGKIVTTLGVGSHLKYWGVKNDKIIELDWWENYKLTTDVELTAAPTRHFSGRGLKRGQTLWASFILKIKGYQIFIGSDSGYDSRFKKIGMKFGKFDLAFLECGQYGKYWPQIHMFPEQTVMAANDLNAQKVVPVHWGKFVLSSHPWNEPIKRFVKAAKKNNLEYISPRIGEPFYIDREFKQEEWWELEG